MKGKVIWSIGIFVFLLLVVLIMGSSFFSTLLIDRPTQDLAESQAQAAALLQEMDLPQDFALPPAEEVTINAGEVTLAGSYYENPQEGQCAVLLLHGYTGTRYGTLQYAPLFWDRGCDLLAYDARGHGASTDAYHTFGYHEKVDGQAAYAWLLDRADLTPSRVGVTGVSYGAATALQMLPLIPEAAFVLADSPYQDLRTIVLYQAVEQFGAWAKLFTFPSFLLAERRADFVVDEVSPKTAVAGTTVPILLIHSLTDGFTPYTNSEAIYANSNQATTELHINEWGSDHAADIITDYKAYEAIVDGFLAEKVPGFGLDSGR